MPFCSACGSEITGGNFCPYCGKPTGFAQVQADIEQRSPGAMQQPHAPQYLSPAPPAAYIPYSSLQPPAATQIASRAPAHRVLIFSLIGVASMFAALLASFLPWVSYSGVTIGGLHRDGILVLVLGLMGVAFAFVAAMLKSRWPFPVIIVLGIVVAAVTITDILDLTGTIGLSLSNVGVGLFVGVAAGVVAVVAGSAGTALRPTNSPLP